MPVRIWYGKGGTGTNLGCKDLRLAWQRANKQAREREREREREKILKERHSFIISLTKPIHNLRLVLAKAVFLYQCEEICIVALHIALKLQQTFQLSVALLMTTIDVRF
jgi:hypothetical protein